MPKRSFSVAFKLEAIIFAENNSNEASSRKFGVDSKQIREWKKQKTSLEILKNECSTRKNLSGQGRKITNQEMECDLVDWIVDMRSQGNRVSRKLIRQKALEIMAQTDSCPDFKASCGWLQKFLDRNGFSLRRVTSVAQKEPAAFLEKIVSFIIYTLQKRQQEQIKDCNIIAMDETAVYFDMTSNTTVDLRGNKTVSIRSTGHEKSHFTVALAAKGDGTKLKPFVVFKQAIREVKTLQDINGAKIISIKNGWMNEDTTVEWLNQIYGKLSFERRMLVWDSYRCHISTKTKNHLKKFNTCTAVIPGGCTKYIQAPDVSWNKPFKDKIREKYDKWFAQEGNKEFTSGGNLKAPNKRLVVEWIISAWNDLPSKLIIESFKTVGQTIDLHGSEDDKIHCFKEGQPCRAAWDMFLAEKDRLRTLDQEIILEDAVDLEQDSENEIVIDEEDDN